MSPKAYSYIRFSRPEQIRGDSLRRQTEATDAWCAKKGVTLDQTLTDLGVSGFRGANRVRGNFGKFLALVEAGKVPKGSYLVVESLDRISREEVLDVLPAFTDLLNAGIVVVSLIDGQEYSRERIIRDPTALIICIISMMRANEESKVKSERVGDAWRKKLASGVVMTARVPAWLRIVERDGKRVIELIEERAVVVRRIFSETVRGYGRRQIAARLQMMGVPTFGGGTRWQASYVKKIVENRATYGEMQPFTRTEDGRRVPSGDPRPGYFPAVVDEATFLLANEAKGRRATTAGPRTEGVTNLLQGIARCDCGARMVRRFKGSGPKGGAPYIICSDADAKACSNDRKWRIDEVERIVVGGTSKIDVAALLSSEPDRDGPTLETVEAKIADRNRRREINLTIAEEGDPAARARVLAYGAEIRELEAQAVELRRLRTVADAWPDAAARRMWMSELVDRMDAVTGDERTELRTRLAQELRSVVKGVRFTYHEIYVIYPKAPPVPGIISIPADRQVRIFCDHPRYFETMPEPDVDEERRQSWNLRAFIAHRQMTRASTSLAA